MRERKGRGVVMAGAVNGIGRAIAEDGVGEGLKVVLVFLRVWSTTALGASCHGDQLFESAFHPQRRDTNP